jgi:MFS family permease
VGVAIVGGIVGAITCGFLGFAVQALLGPTWFLFLEVLGMVFGGLGGAIASLVAATDCMGPSRWPRSLRGRAILWGIVGTLASGLLLGGLFAGRAPVIKVAGIVYLAVSGSIAPLVAWADRTRPDRQPATWRTWLLAASPLLIGMAIIVGRFAIVPSIPTDHGSGVPQATSRAAPPGPAFQPTTWWAVVKGDSSAAIAATMKTLREGSVPLLQSLFFLALPISFLAYGALLGGRAVRPFFLEPDEANSSPTSPGLDNPTTS